MARAIRRCPRTPACSAVPMVCSRLKRTTTTTATTATATATTRTSCNASHPPGHPSSGGILGSHIASKLPNNKATPIVSSINHLTYPHLCVDHLQSRALLLRLRTRAPQCLRAVGSVPAPHTRSGWHTGHCGRRLPVAAHAHIAHAHDYRDAHERAERERESGRRTMSIIYHLTSTQTGVRTPPTCATRIPPPQQPPPRTPRPNAAACARCGRGPHDAPGHHRPRRATHANIAPPHCTRLHAVPARDCVTCVSNHRQTQTYT